MSLAQQYIKDKYSNHANGIHHYEVTQYSGKQTVGDGPADYSHKLEVNSDYPGANQHQIENMNNENKIRKDKLEYYLHNILVHLKKNLLN